MVTCMTIAPAFAESPLIKGNIQRSNVIQDKSPAEPGAAERAPLEGKADSTAPFDVAVDAQQPSDGQISKELRDKTLLLQNGGSAKLDAQQQSPLQAKAEGGEEIYGCLGALLNLFNGGILKIFPQSDLNRFDVQPGDRIVGVNGHRYDFRTIIKEMVGTPGTIVELDIRKPDKTVNHLQVRRTDARLLPQTGMYKQLTQKNRYW